jgi:glycosyltransferase involved in cell wall biosynthesis
MIKQCLKQITILTIGQPSTNPRTVKEAIALNEAGYKVTVLYSSLSAWAIKFDEEIIKKHPSIKWIRVSDSPSLKSLRYVFARLQQIVSTLLAMVFNNNLYWSIRSVSHTHRQLVSAAEKTHADIFIAHNLGALAAAVSVATNKKKFCAFDAEDYHRGQAAKNSRVYKRVLKIEDHFFPRLNYCSAASPLIGEAYKKIYDFLNPVIINNYFSKDFISGNTLQYKTGDILKLIWFSQTIGKNRGIEDIVEAMGKIKNEKIHCTLLGLCSSNTKEYFLDLAAKNRLKKHQLIFMQPVAPDNIFNIASGHHIGLATETGRDENNKLALSNKIFTYLISALAILASDTPAQQQFMNENQQIGYIYKSGNSDKLACFIQKLMDDNSLLNLMRSNSKSLAENRLNFENEKIKLLSTVEKVLN